MYLRHIFLHIPGDIAFHLLQLYSIHLIAMDSVKTKDVPQSANGTKPMTSVEEYQRRWAQLMDDTAKQIQKIRGAQIRFSRSLTDV